MLIFAFILISFTSSIEFYIVLPLATIIYNNYIFLFHSTRKLHLDRPYYKSIITINIICIYSLYRKYSLKNI